MKKLSFFYLPLLFSCNQRNYSILEDDISSLKSQNDSLTVVLAATREQAGKEKEFALYQVARQQEEFRKLKIMAEQQQAKARVQQKIAEEAQMLTERRLIYSEQLRVILDEQRQAVIAERNLADKLRLEVEIMRKKYDSLLIKCQ
jgi:hypothetical protein